MVLMVNATVHYGSYVVCCGEYEEVPNGHCKMIGQADDRSSLYVLTSAKMR